MPKTTAERKKEITYPAFCELLPVRDFLDNVMVRDDGSFVAGFHLTGSQTYFGDDADRNDLKRRLENLFLTIPEESMRMQFRYEVEESLGDLLERYEDARKSNDPRVVALDQERIAIWKKQCERGEYITRTAAVYFVWNPSMHDKMMQDGGKVARKKPDAVGKQDPQTTSEKISTLIDKFFSAGSVDKNIQKRRKVHEEQLQKFETLIAGAHSSLAGAGLGPQRMTHEDLFLEIKRSLCPIGSNTLPFRTYKNADGHLSTFALADRYISAREQLSCVSILGQDETSLNIDGFLWSSVTVKIAPDTTYSGVLRQLLTLGFPLVVNSQLYVPDQRKVLDTYKKRFKKYQSSLNDGKGGRRVDLTAQVAARELNDIQEKIIASSSKTVKMAITIMTRSSAPAVTSEQHEAAARQLSERVQKILYVVGNINGAIGFAENLALRDVFINSLPGMAGEMKRDLDLLTEHAADLVPVEVPYAGTVDDLSMLIRTPWRQLIPMSHFSPSLENANMILVGVSGTGKGMYVGKMLLTYVRKNAKISILERGDTYEGLVEYLGGRMLTISLDSPYTINPFDLEQGVSVPSNDHISFLKTLIRFMIGDSSSSDTDLLDSAILMAIQSAYATASIREIKIPMLSDVRDELRYYKDPDKNRRVEEEAHQAATKLRPWVDDGMYAGLFDRQTSIDMSSPCLYFNIEKLSDDPKLETAMSLMIAYTTSKRSAGSGKEKSITILDECWSLLENERLSGEIKQMFRTARKRDACIWALSQSMGDFTGSIDKPSEFGEAILTTTAIKMIGRQKGNLEVLDHFVHLNRTTIDYISNLSMTQKGKMSEFVGVLGENSETTFASEVVMTPREYWIMTTYPREKTWRKYFRAKNAHLPLEEQYAKMATLYPNGISSLQPLPEEISGEVWSFFHRESMTPTVKESFEDTLARAIA